MLRLLKYWFHKALRRSGVSCEASLSASATITAFLAGFTVLSDWAGDDGAADMVDDGAKETDAVDDAGCGDGSC